MTNSDDFKVIKNTDEKTTILYYENVDIDGLIARQPFYDLIVKTGRKKIYNRAHEWCCGHGAIGFKMLQEQLCNHLVLTDKFLPATTSCKFTAGVNELNDLVTIYNNEFLGELPDTEKWDLFMANPPWRPELVQNFYKNWSPDDIRKQFDINWETHTILWDNISKYLTDDADVYLFEHARFSNRDTWKDQIAAAGLKIHDIYSPFIGETYVMHLIKN